MALRPVPPIRGVYAWRILLVDSYRHPGRVHHWELCWKSFWIGIQHWYACVVQLESLSGGHHGAILGATSGHLVVISEGIMTVILG